VREFLNPTGRRSTGRRRARATAAAPARQRRTTARTPSATASSGDISQIAQQIADLKQQLVRQVQVRDEQLRQLLGLSRRRRRRQTQPRG
jgi:hypothetical protein